MALICSLSSEPCTEPVVTKNGDVYERRLIEKHIAVTGLDPITKEPLSVSDLIALKTVPSPAAIRPKTAAQQGIPAMLQGFAAEWDSMMLEVFTLKQQLTSAQQQLSSALYQQDAACRVIARLIKERDSYKRELGAVRTSAGSENGMDVDNDATSGAKVLPEAIVKRMEAKTAVLSNARATRKIGPSVATRDKVASYQSRTHQAPHKSGVVTSLDVVGDYIVTGGADKNVVVVDQTTEKKVATLTGHKKPVTSVRAVKTENGFRIASGSEDGQLQTWVSVGSSGNFESNASLVVKSSAITGLDIHPVGDVILAGFADGSFSLVDVASSAVFSHTDAKLSSPITAVQFHPDGEILATAGEDGLIHIWSVSTFAHMATFTGHTAAVVGISFSENGYTLVSASKDQTIKCWDLQEIGQVQSVSVSGFNPTALSYDFSGRFLAVGLTPASASNATPREVRVFTGRNLDLVSTFNLAKGDVHAIRWGTDAQWFSFAQERNIHVWSS